MPFNGSGVYSLPSTTVTPAVSGTTIDSSEFNTFTADLATALTNCVTKDGQTANPILDSPKVDEILDTNGNEALVIAATASAVNEVRLINSATGNAPALAATGDDTNISLELTPKGTGDVTVSTGRVGRSVTETAAATTSGTSVDYTSIPSWVRKITVMFDSVSADATFALYVQLGDTNGLDTSGYTNDCMSFDATADIMQKGGVTTGLTACFSATDTVGLNGIMTITNVTGNVWIYSSHLMERGTKYQWMGSGTHTLTDTLDRLRILSSQTFDAGQVNILYEG